MTEPRSRRSLASSHQTPSRRRLLEAGKRVHSRIVSGRYPEEFEAAFQRASTAYSTLLCQEPDFALENNVSARLLSLWKQVLQERPHLDSEAEKQYHHLVAKANDGRVRGLCLCSLGDLYRYRGDVVSARRFYQQAMQSCADLGKPFNQMAVITSQQPPSAQVSLAAVYYYFRAMSAKLSFPSRSNLLDAYSASREASESAPIPRWIRCVIRAHESILTRIELDQVMSSVAAATKPLFLATSVRIQSLNMVLIMFLGLLELSSLDDELRDLSWQVLLHIFQWRMTGVALSPIRRPDVPLSVFLIYLCSNLSRIHSSLHMHLVRLCSSFDVDVDDADAGKHAEDLNRTSELCMAQFSGVSSIEEKVPNWSAMLSSKSYLSVDFLRKSALTLAKLLNLDVSDQHAPLVVLDVPNIALKFGRDRVFSCRGLAICLHHFRARGCRCVGFVPAHCLDMDAVASQRRLQRVDGFSGNKAAMPDNVALLRKLQKRGFIIDTPSQDYDDSYTIEFARRHDGCVLSNDRYRDAVQKCSSAEQRREMAEFIGTRICSFTFTADKLLPNPDFEWPVHHKQHLAI